MDVYCVAVVTTDVGMLTGLPQPVPVQSSCASSVNINIPPALRAPDVDC